MCYHYQTFKNPNSISIQRINECDERKNTNFVNKDLIKRNRNIDLNIFDWMDNIESGIHSPPGTLDSCTLRVKSFENVCTIYVTILYVIIVLHFNNRWRC